MSFNKVAILTSGGDSPGMNSVLKYLVNSCINNNIKPFGVYDGYKGLIDKNIIELTKEKVNEIGGKGGSILFSSRFPEFKKPEIRKQAVQNLKELGIECLIAIGGDGTLTGAKLLEEEGLNVIGIPGTIDNDISFSDSTVGYQTTLQTIVESIEKIRDTSHTHNRLNIVEVMGRNCGDLALSAAIITDAEIVSFSEKKLSEEEIIKQALEHRKNGKRSIIVIVSELIYDVDKLSKRIEKETNIESRSTVLGHVQRGGRPNSIERYFARLTASKTIEEFKNNNFGNVICVYKNETKPIKISKVLETNNNYNKEIYNAYLSTK